MLNKIKMVVTKKLDNYFVDKIQLERYKNKNLVLTDKIILSNNNSFDNIDINLDEFEDSTIIFKDSSFNSINIRNTYNTYTTLKFINCNINNGQFLLNSKSTVELQDTNINKIKILAKKINLCNSFVKPIESTSVLDFGCSYTDEIIFNNVIQCCPISNINLHSRKITINSSNITLNRDYNEATINDSSIIVDGMSEIKWLNIKNSCIAGIGDKCNNISCSSIFSSETVNIDDVDIETEILSIEKNSTFNIISPLTKINNLLIVGKNSTINNTNGNINIEKLYLNGKSSIKSSNFKFTNCKENCIRIEPNKLKCEREKLIKTLTLVLEKNDR